MKRLIIAEKPSVATDISRALGKFTRKGEYYENDDTIITSAVGHIVELQMPEDYDKKLGFWRMESLPIIPEEFKLKPIEKTKKKFAEIKKLLARKDVGEVINACDAGREGELIFHYLYRLAGGKKPVRRLWMSSMTREGIREAFQRLRDGEDMAPLADAARCRSEADWLIGINCTRGVTKRLFGGRAGNVAGVGRVQTPTLAIVMERELQIRKFEPRTYWRITGNFEITQGAYSGMYQKPGYKKGADEHDRSDRLWEREQAEAVLAALQGSPTAAVSEEKKKATQLSPRLYDLTTLQREANNRFGYSARRTLQLAQSLYERHKVITYPRTDARVLPEDYPATCRRVMESLRDDLQPLARKALDAGWIRPNKRIFNNAGVSDHFAIIPTEQSPKSLSAEESKIFDMIARRFLAVFYPAAEFDVTTRLSVVAEHTFRTEGKVLVAPGWLEVYGRSTLDERDTILPPLTEADGSPPTARTLGGDLEETQTRPPPRYTEATLLSAMEGAGKLVDDEELADAMKEKGLGTPATRAQIIERLVAEKYLERDRRDLVPTVKAESLLEFLSAINAEVLTSPALTGEWEYKLHQIENRRLKGDAFMKEIADATRSIIGRIKQYEEKGED
ncbi:MAG: DNA topoisomerase III, partial [Puniceicoccaceae bacterium]